MAEEQTQASTPQTAPAKAQSTPVQSQPVKQPESVYTLAELIEGAQAFGVTPAVMAGALRTVKQKTMTKADAQAAVTTFLRKKV